MQFHRSTALKGLKSPISTAGLISILAILVGTQFKAAAATLKGLQS